jgi:hypothetical protein
MDVYSRATSFFSTLVRDTAQVKELDGDVLSNLNIVVVTHGLTLRLLLMRYFHLRVSQFEASVNPANASLVVMERRCSARGHGGGSSSSSSSAASCPPGAGAGALTTAGDGAGGKVFEWYELDEASQRALNLRDKRYDAKPAPPAPAAPAPVAAAPAAQAARGAAAGTVETAAEMAAAAAVLPKRKPWPTSFHNYYESPPRPSSSAIGDH